MAAVAYPLANIPARRPSAGGRGRQRPGRPRVNHLRLVEEPLFREPIFEELANAANPTPGEWSVWHRPLLVIPRHQILRDPSLFDAVPAVFEPVPVPLSAPAEPLDRPVRVPLLASATDPARASMQAGRYRLRRLLACVALGLAIFGGLSGANALAGTHQGTPVVLAGSVPVAGGQVYTVRAGDTLWSIASRVYPSGDPRALVATLVTEIGTSAPTPGEQLRLP